MSTRVTRVDYCQFLVSSQINYTLTYFADHSQGFSHDRIKRYLEREKMTPRLLWEHVKEEVELSEEGYVVFDDTVLDHNHSRLIELVRRQWSGNAKQVIRGIGVVTCVYVNPELDQFWAIDYRLYDPDRDGKSKLDHVQVTGADGIVLICPFCDIMYEINQRSIERQAGVTYRLPVLYYPQLLGLALGFTPDELGFRLNRVKARTLIQQFAEE